MSPRPTDGPQVETRPLGVNCRFHAAPPFTLSWRPSSFRSTFMLIGKRLIWLVTFAGPVGLPWNCSWK